MSSKRIAKNTLYLYVRMILIMGVTLYTSRVVLQQLGVSDFGVYNLVAGLVAMMGFFNAAMSSATQRYLSFDLGKGDLVRVQKTFSATLTIHLGIGILVVLLAETLGLWYVNNVMIFPEERIKAVNIVYQFSIATFILNIIQVPYNALIIAHERMSVYAYVSIVEALMKLGIVFLLVYFGDDKLITYAVLTFIVALITRLAYQIYCRRNFEESRYRFEYDQPFYKELIGFTGWNLFGNVAVVVKGQGINLLLNSFFGTLINATYALTLQVQGAINLFVHNFQLAVNPQIIKSYSQGLLQKTHSLMFMSSKLSYFLMLLLVSPILLNTTMVLEFWLGTPPDRMVIFVQLTLVNVLIDSISGPLMTGAQATGRIKWYQIIVGTLIFLNLPLSYFLLKIVDGKPEIVFYISIVISLFSLCFRLYFLKVIMELNLSFYLKSVLARILLVSVIVALPIYWLRQMMTNISFPMFLLEAILLTIFNLTVVFFLGLTKDERQKSLTLFKNN